MKREERERERHELTKKAQQQQRQRHCRSLQLNSFYSAFYCTPKRQFKSVEISHIICFNETAREQHEESRENAPRYRAVLSSKKRVFKHILMRARELFLGDNYWRKSPRLARVRLSERKRDDVDWIKFNFAQLGDEAENKQVSLTPRERKREKQTKQ
jgi:hypothetical protein